MDSRVILKISNSDLDELLSVVESGSNKAKRWENFEKSEASKSLSRAGFGELNKTWYLKPDGLEAMCRNFLRTYSGERSERAEKFRAHIQGVIAKQNQEFNEYLAEHKIELRKYERDADNSDILFSFITGAMIGIPCLFILFVVWAMFSDGSDQPRRGSGSDSYSNTIESEVISCARSLRSQLSSACTADPVTTYCGIVNGSSGIIGSGCTGIIRSKGSYQAQVEFCQRETSNYAGLTCSSSSR